MNSNLADTARSLHLILYRWKVVLILICRYAKYFPEIAAITLMLKQRPSHNPHIQFRPIRHSDLEELQKLHGDMFPIRYESEFFQNVVNGRDIVSWGAVDRNRPHGQDEELIGFVTARTGLAKDSEIRLSKLKSNTGLHPDTWSCRSIEMLV